MEYDEVFMSLCQQEENDRSSSHLTELRTTLPIDVPADSASKLPSISLSPSDCNGSLSATSTKKKNRVFSTIKTDHEIEVARATSVPARTHKDTKYCLGLWESWKEWRQMENHDVIESIEKLSKSKMEFWLSRFVVEVRQIFFNITPTILPIIFVYRFEKKMGLNLHQTLCITL